MLRIGPPQAKDGRLWGGEQRQNDISTRDKGTVFHYVSGSLGITVITITLDHGDPRNHWAITVTAP